MFDKVNPKIVTTAAALLAGLLANKIISSTWRKTTGRPAPTDEEGPELELKEAIAFALLSGAVIALARLVAERGATKLVTGRIAKDVE